MREMTVARGLAELKLLTKRIESGINETVFVTHKKKSSDRVNEMSLNEYEKQVKGKYESIMDLMNERGKIKAAIATSNAEKDLIVAGQKMKVIEAIERKNNIELEVQLLDTMSAQYRKALSSVGSINSRVDNDLLGLMESMAANKDAKDMAQAMEDLSKNYRDNHEYELVDPLELKNKIDELRQEIDLFMSEVDFALSESNVLNRITVE